MKACLSLVLVSLLLLSPITGTLCDGLKSDIEYGQGGGVHLKLDACAPNGAGPFPVAILVHGGGWSGGDKATDITPLFKPLTNAGFLWFSINYRLAPIHRWPDCLADVQTAIRWVKAHAADYKGDPNRIALIGYSSGAHLVCLSVMLAGDETRVQAVVGLAAPTDLVQDTERRGGLSNSLQALLDKPQAVDDATHALLAQMSPITHVHPGLPPFLLLHGTADKSVPYVQSLNFQTKLRNAGVPCDLITLGNAPHSIATWDAHSPGYEARITEWLGQTLGRFSPKPLGTGQSDGPSEISVAADGSGLYRTVQEAVNAAPTGSPNHPTTIHVKPGIYKEIVYVQREKRYVRLVGDDPDPAKTVITYGLYAGMNGLDGKPIGTFRTPTATIDADDFTVSNITFENSAGPVGQALAVRLDGDRIAFHHCRFLGWQDTILDNRGRHYYDRCEINGAVDFIFGGGTACYDQCVVTELRENGGDLTAPSTPKEQSYGLVFLNCRLSKGPKVLPGSTGLMRPWRGSGMSAFINCILDDDIKAAGWDPWNGREKTCRADEYGSRTPDGRPVSRSARAPWVRRLSAAEAAHFTIQRIFAGWNPARQK